MKYECPKHAKEALVESRLLKCWATKLVSNHNRFHLGIEILLRTPQSITDSGDDLYSQEAFSGRSFQNDVEQGKIAIHLTILNQQKLYKQKLQTDNCTETANCTKGLVPHNKEISSFCMNHNISR